MNPIRRSDKATALLLLLLFLLSLHCLGKLLHFRGSSPVPSKEKQFVQIGEEAGPAGVFSFAGNPSLQEALAMAGIPWRHGETSEEQPSLVSGERLVVTREEGRAVLSRKQMNGFFKKTLRIPLSINTESEVGLTAIPGISPGLAKSIVEERSRAGGYTQVEDLMRVPGIGHQRFLKIRPFVTL